MTSAFGLKAIGLVLLSHLAGIAVCYVDVATVDGEPIGCVVLVTRNVAGQTQHVVASCRPLSSLLFFARRLREKFAGTPIAVHFASA